MMTPHPPEFTDTDPRAMEVWLDLLRRMSPGEKLAAALHLSELALRMSEAGVRAAYPRASDREVFLRAAARRLPRESLIRVYGWDPETDVIPR
jgi:predicted RNA-binding Zn ribbon-like protein